MTNYVSPAALPPHVIEREDMRAALACHDFGTVFTLARKWGGISFTKIADACGMKTDRVGTVAKGDGRITTIDKIFAVADGLRIPGALLGLAPRPWETHSPLPAATTPGAPIGRAAVLHDRSGEDYAQAIRETSQHIIALDNMYGGASIADAAARAFTSVHHRLAQHDHGPAHERDINAAAAELAEIAGWTLFDAEKQRLSRRMNQEALLLAKLSGDLSIELLVLQNIAMQAGWVDRPREELSIARSVLENARLSPRVESIFRIREAKGLTGCGGSAEVARSFHRARSLLQDGCQETDPAWAWWVTTDEIDGHEGWAHAQTGQHRKAVVPLQRAMLQSAGAKVGYRGISGARLLGVFLELRAWSDAEEIATALLSTVREQASTRTLNLLRSCAHQEQQLPKSPVGLRDALHALAEAVEEAEAVA